jgi:hypothetical protein
MPNILEDVEAAAGHVKRDIRAELPKLMETLGVNTASEHEAMHAAIVWIVGELAKFAPTGAAAVATEIASVL